MLSVSSPLMKMAPETTLRVATLNVRGLAGKKKQSQVHRLLTDHDIDVLAVQETKVDGEEETGSMVRRFTVDFTPLLATQLGHRPGVYCLSKSCLVWL